MKLLRELDAEDRSVTGTIATTYTFGARFFESQLLDAFADRHNSRNTIVVIDADTYEDTLNPETDATEFHQTAYPKAAGSRYYLAPADSGNATFHPKVVFQAGEKRANAVIGSANLTQQGYTSNREIVTSVATEAETTDTEAAALLNDCRSYLQQLADHPATATWSSITTNRYQGILDDSSWLEDATPPTHRETQLLHNLDRPLLTQLRDNIDAYGEQIQSVDIITPFYGTGLAVPRTFTDDGIETTLYLQDTDTQIELDELSTWLEEPNAQAVRLDADRYVHGKLLLITTDAATYCFSGSANGSYSALLQTAGSPQRSGGNHEAGVLSRTPSDSHFTYLLTSEHVQASDPIDVETFTPGVLTEFEDRADTANSRDKPTIWPPIVTVHQRAHGGPRVTVGVTVDANEIDLQRTSITLELSQLSTEEHTTLSFHPTDRIRRKLTTETETETDDDHDSYNRHRYSKTVHNPAVQTLVKRGCRARVCVDTTDDDQIHSGYRWVETTPPDDSAAGGDAGSRAGTDTLPQTMTDLFLLDDIDQRENILASINGMIGDMRNAPDDVTTTQPDPPGNQAQDGIRVRAWDSASRSSNRSSAISTCYDEWLEDMTKLSKVRANPDTAFDAVAARVRAINQCNIQLIALRKSGIGDNLPSDLPTKTTNRLYTATEYGELASRLHWFLTNGTSVVEETTTESSTSTDTVYTWCQEDILPQIIVGALIGEYQLASSTEEYSRYFSRSFERLALDCFPTTSSFAHWATTDTLDITLGAVRDTISPIVDQLDRYEYATYLPFEFRDTTKVDDATLRFLGRMLAEANEIATYETISDHHYKLLQYAGGATSR